MPSPSAEQIFFELFESLPRQGPGSRACAARALALCRHLPPEPVVLDLGCGTGGQTLHLVALTSGAIFAIDRHAPSIARLRATLARLGLSRRVHPVVGDITNPSFALESVDLIWSEGALYSFGIGNALRVCRRLLRPGGYLAFTDAVWCKPQPPRELKASFDVDYPDMATVPDLLSMIGAHGFSLLGHFPLPEAAWWDDYYSPMEQRLAELRVQYAGSGEALAVLDELAREPAMRRKYPDYYAYEFFVARRQE